MGVRVFVHVGVHVYIYILIILRIQILLKNACEHPDFTGLILYIDEMFKRPERLN